jgi:predicted cobalt transporter CbtA
MEITYSVVIKRALIAAVVAGVCMALWAFFVVEPTIDDAIALEEATAQVAGGDHGHDEDPLFTRSQQVGGGVLATVLFAVAVAVVFGTVYATVRHRIPAMSDFTRSIWLAAVAFGTTALFPVLKYPANPPAVGDPDTVNERTIQYVVLVAFGIVAAILLCQLSGWLRTRVDFDHRVIILVAAVIVVYGGALLFFPASPDSIAPEVPAGLIWRFRLQSLGGLALLWTVLGLGFGWLMDRITATETEGAVVRA